MADLYSIARPFLLRMDAETAHNLALKALQAGFAPKVHPVSSPALETILWDRRFPNPVGLAAGFDKNAAALAPLLGIGFGFVEAGTVTPQPQEGNPKPRIRRDHATRSVINAMGFPNRGMEAFRANIESFLSRRPHPPGLIGVNIGRNKDQTDAEKDYRLLIRTLGPLADYITVNISSPNTPGLRDLQKREYLLPLLNGLMEERARSCGGAPPPLLVKLSPDCTESEQEEIAATVMGAGIDGLILSNTTLERPAGLPAGFARAKGGLSGPLLKNRSTAAIRRMYRLTGGKIPLIGVGGIETAEDVYEKIKAGASLVQLYTALVFHGPGVIETINKGLIGLLKKDNFAAIADAVGADHKTRRESA